MGVVHPSNRGRSSASLLDDNVLRTAEMFLFSSTVAAETGTVFLKKERSRTRIARFTGGRNMAGVLEVDCFVAVWVVESIGTCFLFKWLKTSKYRVGEMMLEQKKKIRVDPCTNRRTKTFCYRKV